MKRWIHSLLIGYSILGLCKIQPLIEESEQLVSQWVEIEKGDIIGTVVDEVGKPLIAQIRFFDGDGGLVKRVQTDLEGTFETMLEEGQYTLEVSKGYEYESKELSIEVKKGDSLSLNNISLKRLTDWSAKGYYSGDLHQHSHFSKDGVNTVEEILRGDLANGLNFGALSDHHSVDGNDEWISLSEELDFLAIPAQEITTGQGHYVAINTSELIDMTAIDSEINVTEMINQIHQLGGLAQINHPGRDFPFWEMANRFDAIEIWNGKAMPPLPNQSEIDESYCYNQMSKEKWFELLNSGVKITALGNSDNHDISGEQIRTPLSENELFNKWRAQGLYNGNPRNYVKATDLTVDGILDGIKNGHVFITNGPLMDITLNEVTFGDTLEDPSEVEISYLIASNNSQLNVLNIIADGKVIETISLAEDVPTIGTLTLNLSNYTWVVFEVLTNSYAYAISNPIYMK